MSDDVNIYIELYQKMVDFFESIYHFLLKIIINIQKIGIPCSQSRYSQSAALLDSIK